MLPEPDLPFQLHEIRSLHDPQLPAWMRLYTTAFPPQERVAIEDILAMIEHKDGGELPGVCFQSILMRRALVGLLASQRFDDPGVLFLWYLALGPQHRSRGLGTQIYTRLAEQCGRSLRCILFDVEIPDLAESEVERQIRIRRIQFYRRLGVRQLTGVHYAIQLEPESEPLPMHLMIHPLQPLTGQQACDLALQVVDPGWLQVLRQPELV